MGKSPLKRFRNILALLSSLLFLVLAPAIVLCAGVNGSGSSGAIMQLLLDDIEEFERLDSVDSLSQYEIGSFLQEYGHSVYPFQSGKGLYRFGITKDSLLSVGATVKLKGDTEVLSFPDYAIINVIQGPDGKDTDYATFKVHPLLLKRLMSEGFFSYAEADMKVGRSLEAARRLSNLPPHTGSPNQEYKYKGEGVIFGLVDLGIDYRHRTFEGRSGQSRHIESWIQGTGINGSSEWGYGDIDEGQELLSRRYDTQQESHATHVAGIAAGSGDGLGPLYQGIAPEASIVSVSNSFYLNDIEETGHSTILDGVEYIFSVARQKEMPAVVNLSLATNIGPHDGEAVFDKAVVAQTGIGRIVVTAAGNDGANRLHVKGRATSQNSIRTFFEQSEGFGNNYLDIWGNAGEEFCVRVGILRNGEFLWDNDYACTESNRVKKLRIDSYGIDFTISCSSSEFNGKPRLFVRSEDTWADDLALEITSSEGASVHIWNCGPGGSQGLPLYSKSIPGFSSGDTEYIIGEIGGNSPDIITVGAYTSTSIYRDYLGNNRQGAESSELYRLAFFSSKGPTATEAIKPDITAPGHVIISSLNTGDQRYRRGGNLSYSLVVEGNASNGNSPFGTQSGTSMSSPVVAGTVALMLEAYPYLTTQEAIEILKKTAYTDEYTGFIEEGGNNYWGAGKLDISAAVEEAERYGSLAQSNVKFNILQNPVEQDILTLELADENGVGIFDIRLFDTTGRLAGIWRKEVSLSEEALIEIDVSNIGAGYYFVSAGNSQNSISEPIWIIR